MVLVDFLIFVVAFAIINVISFCDISDSRKIAVIGK